MLENVTKTRHNKDVERNNKSCKSEAQNGGQRGSLKRKRQMLKGTQTTSDRRETNRASNKLQSLRREANQITISPVWG